jgi:hypothetical protein
MPTAAKAIAADKDRNGALLGRCGQPSDDAISVKDKRREIGTLAAINGSTG